ncbi:hypothetical protein DTO271G3_6239 [Paecilomyces variotii]|nr:hypothetical protein DTO271G3_6239 [Paecilomyces variotii]
MKVQDNGVMVVIELTAGVHNHEYELMAHKATTAVRQLAAQEVAKGYKPAEVKKMLFNSRNGNREAVLAAGGTEFNLKDIHNAAQVLAKRKQPDVKLDEEIWPLPRGGLNFTGLLMGFRMRIVRWRQRLLTGLSIFAIGRIKNGSKIYVRSLNLSDVKEQKS